MIFMKKNRLLDKFFYFFSKIESFYPNNPFGKIPLATFEEYIKLHTISKNNETLLADKIENLYNTINKYEQ